MIFLTHEATTKIIGSFATIALAKNYLSSIGREDYDSYIYLKRIEEMNYISRITYVDDVCIYNNSDFWLNEAHNINDDFTNYIVKDVFGELVNNDDFEIEMNNNSQRVSGIYSVADQIYYNMLIGGEFISLFREECVVTGLGDESGLSIASAISNVIPLVMTGSFKEAVVVLSLLTRTSYLNEERLQKYMSMLSSADAIIYT